MYLKIQKTPFPLPLLDAWDLSHIHYEDLVETPGGKSHNTVGPLYDRVPLEFLILKLVHTKPLTIHQL